MLQFMRSQRVWHDWVTELNWTVEIIFQIAHQLGWLKPIYISITETFHVHLTVWHNPVRLAKYLLIENFMSQKYTFDILKAKPSHFNYHGYYSSWHYLYVHYPCINSSWDNKLITTDWQAVFLRFVQHRDNRQLICNFIYLFIGHIGVLYIIFNLIFNF